MTRHLARGARAVLLLVAAVAPASAQRGPLADPVVRENVTVKLGPHTYAIPDGNVPLVPNIGIVVGSRATLIIDTGLGRQNGETVMREVAKVSKNKELFFASTHFHVEHTMGYNAFPATAKYINASAQEAEFAEGGLPQVKRFSGFAPSVAARLTDVSRRVADITFDREYLLDLGGVRVRFMMVGPTHTKGDTAFFVQGDGVLFAGDVVMNKSFVAANQNSSMKAWLAAFDLFSTLKPTTIVPAHGEIGPGSVLATLQAVVKEIRARTLLLKAQGRTVDETATMVQMEFQAKLPSWPRANGVAALARSAYAEGS
jgi:glyoxylase-like metal-dependent hydrolase (beta-lactamase superfamily II)